MWNKALQFVELSGNFFGGNENAKILNLVFIKVLKISDVKFPSLIWGVIESIKSGFYQSLKNWCNI